MSDDEHGDAVSPQADYQPQSPQEADHEENQEEGEEAPYVPQSPQGEPDYIPQSPQHSPGGGEASYDENAPVSPTAEEEEEEGEEDVHQPVSPVESPEPAGDEDENAPVSPAADDEDEENAHQPVSPVEQPEEAEGGEERENKESYEEPYIPKSPLVEAAMGEEEGEEKGEGEEGAEEEEEATPKRAKRAAIDSDDEDEGRDESRNNDEEKSGGEEEEGGEKPPAKKKRVLDSDDSDDSDAEEGEEKEGIEGLEDEEGDEQQVGDLMANIFGDESDEEGGGGEGERKKRADSDEDMGVVRRDEDDANVEWDFDVMLRSKKAEKKKIRRRKKDGGIDIINDDDGTIEQLVTAMKKAASEDRHSNMERQPATRKRKMLQQVKTVLLRSDLVETMIDGGMMSAISEWLAPLPDKSLPALEIRCELLKVLQGFARLDQGVLKQSGLGKAVMMLFKHPRETKDNKRLAHKLISDWARPIFQIDTDFRSMSREERMERDLAQMPDAKKRRMSSDDGPSSSSSKPSGFRDIQEDLRPGMKGYIGRARVPKISSKDYVVRPASTVEGTFKGEKKSKGFQRLDKATRDFKERTKKLQAKRAVGVSIEGRRMEI